MSNDGGSAFPGPSFTQGGHPNGHNMGMSLRDWFAGQALAGLATDDQWTSTPALARHCYGIADAMLAARNSTPAKEN